MDLLAIHPMTAGKISNNCQANSLLGRSFLCTVPTPATSRPAARQRLFPNLGNQRALKMPAHRLGRSQDSRVPRSSGWRTWTHRGELQRVLLVDRGWNIEMALPQCPPFRQDKLGDSNRSPRVQCTRGGWHSSGEPVQCSRRVEGSGGHQRSCQAHAIPGAERYI